MTELSERYRQAFDVAFDAHAGDVRKGTTTPYVAHVLAVSALVLEHGGDEDQAVAALLHDVAEDAGGERRLGEIAARFGDRVAAIVRVLSDSLVSDPTRKAPWWERKVTYLDQLATAPPDALLVAAADKAHNLGALVDDYRRAGEDLWERFNPEAGRAGQLWYARRVSEVIGARLGAQAARPLIERLQAGAAELAELVRERVGEHQLAIDLDRAAAREAGVRARLGGPQ